MLILTGYSLSWSGVVLACALVTANTRDVTASPRALYESDSGDKSAWRRQCLPPQNDHCPNWYRKSPPVVLISLDGFWVGYFSRNTTPAVSHIGKCGVQAQMYPSYPAVTFTNHYSLVTGLNAESHGIVDDEFYDSELNETFYHKNKTISSDPKWWKGEPIWATAKNTGKRANAYYWPGSEAEINGVRPDIWLKFNSSDSYDNRVDTVLGWLTEPESSRPAIITLYFEDPDSTGPKGVLVHQLWWSTSTTASNFRSIRRRHSSSSNEGILELIYPEAFLGSHKYGPASREVDEALAKVDAAIDRLMSGLYSRNLMQCVNVVIVSDHGMTQTPCNQSLGLKETLQSRFPGDVAEVPEDHVIAYSETSARIRSPDNLTTSLHENSESACHRPAGDSKLTSPFRPYLTHKNLPRRHHYFNSPRIEPLIWELWAGYTVFYSPKGRCPSKGDHGYDPLLFSTEHAIFLAYGPAFHGQRTIRPFKNIEIYNLLCELMDIVPAPNNGSMGSLHPALRYPKKLPEEDYLSDLSDPVVDFKWNHNVIDLGGPASNVPCQGSSRVEKTYSGLSVLIQKHAPLGLPKSSDASLTNILINNDFVTGYSRVTRTPLWTSFMLDQSFRHLTKINGTTFDTKNSCLRQDPRIPADNQPDCSRTSALSFSHLYPPSWNQSLPAAPETMLTSNIVPMTDAFRTTVWSRLWESKRTWLSEAPSGTAFQVHVGPVFDDLFPYGLADFLRLPAWLNSHVTLALFQTVDATCFRNVTNVPSHYFFIATVGRDVNVFVTAPSRLEVHAYILPHEDFQKTQRCQDIDTYLWSHAANVDDVEKITGLRFFTSVPTDEVVLLRTQLPSKSLYDEAGNKQKLDFPV